MGKSAEISSPAANNSEHASPLCLSRETLYELVWAEPVARLAKRWGVSDVAVAKWCRKLNVPRPGRGYWARVQAGHKGGKRPSAAPGSMTPGFSSLGAVGTWTSRSRVTPWTGR